MYIKVRCGRRAQPLTPPQEIIIDGFKSYAQRTVVSGFDPQFNAITGLNGSGKSNILDSICFVLGISNLTQVRAGSLQDLVYKQGQAGITKATVTIVFDNADKAQSPVGYELHDEITVTRQVVIGGRNKYLINGHVAQPGRVQNLFHSVQLNVNNPHFLIMQGRITKVLNMKPAETLSMVEEAAGTRMFETKKMAALKTIEKKDGKLDEINALLRDEITPTLETLRGERTAYLEYQKTRTEVEHLTRFVAAHQLVEAEKTLQQSAAEVEGLAATIAASKATITRSDNEIADKKQNMAIIERKRSADVGAALRDLEGQASELAKELVKANATLAHRDEALVAEKDARKASLKAVAETESAIVAKASEVAKANKAHERCAKEHATSEAAFQDLERQVHAMSMGMTADTDGCARTLTDQLMEAKNEGIRAGAEQQQARMRAAHMKAAAEAKRPAAKESQRQYAAMMKEVDGHRKELQKIEADIAGLGFDESKEAALREQHAKLQTRRTALRDTVDELSAKLAHMEFTYSDPEPGFDRSKVHGLVAELVSVRDAQAATALEVTAGGRLYNVVVDTEQTGKLLLERGQLKKRVTIIPLNRIAGRAVQDGVVRAAQAEVGADNASLALSLVGYEADVQAAMSYVFGSTFVCRSADAAKAVTFNERIQTRSVTLEGDVFDPAGTLTGGAAERGAGVLAQLTTLRNARAELAAVEKELAAAAAQLDGLKAVAAKYAKMAAARNLKAHEVELGEQRVRATACGQVVGELEALEASWKEAEDTLKAAEAKEAAAAKRCTELEKQMLTFEDSRAGALTKAEKEKAVARTALAKSRDKLAEAKQQMDERVLEEQALQSELAAALAAIAALEQTIAGLEAERDKAAAAVEAKKEVYESAAASLTAKKNKLGGYDSALADLSSALETLQTQKSEAEMEIKRAEHKSSRAAATKKDAARAVEALLAEHSWLNTERAYFGVKGSAFDFSDPERSPATAKRRLAELQAAQEKLSKNINMKVLSMFDKAEREYQDLLSKKKTVEEDRSKIQKAIQELDEKKNAALHKAYTQVTRDFGSIFSTLLPGATAKLSPVNEHDVLAGLEVKVGFGKSWKESLTELSGGQRSLVALSLILALLLFKPAPLYILDEVDAALDLSHTQNIGHMLRTHFNKSQFIVVSLKDGMFNNANVLFKTRFVDGLSTVRRYAQGAPAEDKENGPAHPAKRGKTAAAAIASS